MADYNTFLVLETKHNKVELVTSSARKATQLLQPGKRIEVWSRNEKKETIYTKTRKRADRYITAERDYIRKKQEAATKRNLRKGRAYDRPI